MLFLVPVAAIAVGGSTACATKKFVRTSVGQVNDKVDSLGRSVEETQERTRQNEGKIAEVDQKAAAADQKAQGAQTAADRANAAAQQAANTANNAVARTEALDKASKRLVYEVVLSEDQGNFKFGKTELPDEAKMRIDQVIGQLKGQQGKDVYIEVEGHTDNVGPKEMNYQLGLERAEAVKKYLYTQHQIPLHKINVISYGEEKPVSPNNTKDGRAQNRRVVIRVLS
jgi:outer membrane protein OmpA-like peptidoglycan-associated protein